MERFEFYRKRLAKRESENRKRLIMPYIPLDGGKIKKDGKILLNLSSNDYLGLSFNKEILKKGTLFAEKYGNGTGGSRLVTGSPEIYFEIENKIARLKKKEKAVLLNSGYQANITMMPSLCGRKGVIFSDYLNHNSIVRGAILSGAALERFRHNDLDHLEELLKKRENHTPKIIVTESVFSMDGDRADIKKIKEIALNHNALLVVDEAHSTGVLGEKGMGIAGDADVVMGTFGKGAGVFGAYIATSEIMYDYFVNFCEGLIFSTSFPPFTAGAISASLDLIPEMDKEREHLQRMSDKLRSGLNDIGFNTHTSTTQIIPVLTKTEDKALELSRFLEKNGILAIAIRPPTVPDNMSRVRLSITAAHGEEDIDRVLSVFNEFRKKD